MNIHILFYTHELNRNSNYYVECQEKLKQTNKMRFLLISNDQLENQQ